MSEIPEDISKSVRDLAIKIHASSQFSFLSDIGEEIVARAILAERERCAEIAGDWLKAFGESDPQYISAKEFAGSAVMDILDLITNPVAVLPPAG